MNCTPWAWAVLPVWLCGHSSAVACENGYESNPALRYSCFGLFHLFVSLLDISAFPGAGKSGVSFWQWALEASVKDIFSYGDSHKKLTLARGLRTCPSWCCCCVLSFPCQQNGETQRVGSRSRNSVYSYEITRYLVYINRVFSFCAFFKTFLYAG